jgi:hypothetical protein
MICRLSGRAGLSGNAMSRPSLLFDLTEMEGGELIGISRHCAMRATRCVNKCELPWIERPER